MGGDRMVKSLSINPALLVDIGQDTGMLEDLIMLAVNAASKNIEAISQQKMSAITAGMPLPPGFKL
jgi:DNA-binding protein YbaB